jgi:hypothetical protein
LGEDKQYLANIVRKLVSEAQAERQRFEMAPFSTLANGSFCTEESLAILREALAEGFELGVQQDNTITATKPGSGTSYLRSDHDIWNLGKFAKLR